MAAQWFYQTNEGQQSHPVDSRELRRLAEAGIVTPKTLVRKGASGRWVRAENVRGLFQRSTPAPSPSLGASPPGPPTPPSPVPKSGAPSRGVSGESPIRHGLDAAEVNDASEKPERIRPVAWAAIIVGSGTVLLLLWVLVFSGGSEPQQQTWSVEERANWEHYRESRDANQAAKRILNTGEPFSRITEEEQAKYVELQTAALAEAKKVRDDVLAKVHPDLPFNYRSRYQRSLESEPFGFEAATLYDDWVDWHNSNNDDFQFPKKAYGRGFGRFFLASLLASFIFPTVFMFLMLPAVGIVIAAVAVKGEAAFQNKPPILLIVIGFALNAYVLWGWAAFMSGLAGYYAANPEVTHGWLYYVVAFFFSMSPLGYMASKERDNEFLTCCHTMLAGVAFVVFSIWPVSAHCLYGWLLSWFF